MTVTQAAPAPASPWTAKHRLMLAVLLVIGVVGLIAGYAGTSGTLRVSRQVVWVNVAGAGLLFSGAGVALFLTVARREIGRRRLSLFGDLGVVGGTAVDMSARHLGRRPGDGPDHDEVPPGRLLFRGGQGGPQGGEFGGPPEGRQAPLRRVSPRG